MLRLATLLPLSGGGGCCEDGWRGDAGRGGLGEKVGEGVESRRPSGRGGGDKSRLRHLGHDHQRVDEVPAEGSLELPVGGLGGDDNKNRHNKLVKAWHGEAALGIGAVAVARGVRGSLLRDILSEVLEGMHDSEEQRAVRGTHRALQHAARLG